MGSLVENKLEKVVAATICCLRDNDCSHCEECYYKNIEYGCRIKLRDDIIGFFKALEPVYPKKVNCYIDFDGEGHPYNPETYDCGACGKELPWKANYCPECGRKVKWE